jgi:hypothetical protein
MMNIVRREKMPENLCVALELIEGIVYFCLVSRKHNLLKGRLFLFGVA